MQPTCEIQKISLRNKPFYHILGGSIDVGLLGENHHIISLIAGESILLGEDIIPHLWITSYLHC